MFFVRLLALEDAQRKNADASRMRGGIGGLNRRSMQHMYWASLKWNLSNCSSQISSQQFFIDGVRRIEPFKFATVDTIIKWSWSWCDGSQLDVVWDWRRLLICDSGKWLFLAKCKDIKLMCLMPACLILESKSQWKRFFSTYVRTGALSSQATGGKTPSSSSSSDFHENWEKPFKKLLFGFSV